MPLATNSIFTIGFARQAFIVFGGDAIAGFRAYEMGEANTFATVFDADLAFAGAIFQLDTPALPPVGYSPTGDLVKVRPWPNIFDVFPLPPTGTLTAGEGIDAIIWQWGAFSALGPEAQALCVRPGRDGLADNWFFAVPGELTLVQKNPLFP